MDFGEDCRRDDNVMSAGGETPENTYGPARGQDQGDYDISVEDNDQVRSGRETVLGNHWGAGLLILAENTINIVLGNSLLPHRFTDALLETNNVFPSYLSLF